MLTSQPLAASPSQLAKPGLQDATPQAPPTQRGVPLGTLQRLLQRPQLLASAARVTSQPLAATPSQLAEPVLQTPRAQAPPTQLAVALAKAQRVPQAPQVPGSVWMLVSQPLVATPSQLA